MRQKDTIASVQNSLKKWSFEHEVYSGKVSPCCLRSGCTDADLELRSWVSAWFPLRYSVLSPQEFLPLTSWKHCPGPQFLWAALSLVGLVFAFCSGIQVHGEEKRAPHLWEERKEWFALSSLSVSAVRPGLSDQESAPKWRHHLVLAGMTWDGINNPLWFQEALFSPQKFQVFPLISLSQQPGRKGRYKWFYCEDVLQWSSCTVHLLHPTLTRRPVFPVDMVLTLLLICLISPVHPPPLHSIPKLLPEIIVVY